MKTDARVRYTLMRIEEAFFTLLKKKPINRITVRELCDMAEINRATFYTHYTDVYGLMETLEEQTLAKIREYATAELEQSGNLLEGLLRGMVTNNSNATLLTSENCDPNFSRRATALLYDLYRPVLASQLPHLTPRELEEVYRFICGGCSGIMALWFEEECTTPPKIVAERIHIMVEKCIQSLKQ